MSSGDFTANSRCKIYKVNLDISCFIKGTFARPQRKIMWYQICFVQKTKKGKIFSRTRYFTLYLYKQGFKNNR